MIVQKLDFSLEEIRTLLNRLPNDRTPTQSDWGKISTQIKVGLDERIIALTLMREKLDKCIGCGCLSLKVCALYNPDDRASKLGTGPRYLLGDVPVT